MLIKEYIAYTDKNGSWTLDDTKLDLIIDDDNIEQNYQLLHYFEYTFKENKTGYELIKITIK